MRQLAHVLALALAFLAHAARAAQWESLPPLPEPNGGFMTGSLADSIVVIGGTKWTDGRKVWLDKIWQFNPGTMTWTHRGNLPQPLAYAVCGPWKNGLVLAGGFDGTKARTEIWHLTATFQLKPIGHLHTAVSLAQGGVCGDDLLVVNGTPDPAKLDALTPITQRVHLPTGAAKLIHSPGSTAFCTAASAGTGTQLFLHGGARHDPAHAVANLSHAWHFDAPGSQWRALAPYPIAVRAAASAMLDSRHVYIAGGYAETFTASAHLFDTQANTYSPSLPLPLPNCPGLVVHDGYLYSLGGEPAMKVRTDKCWRIRTSTLLPRP